MRGSTATSSATAGVQLLGAKSCHLELPLHHRPPSPLCFFFFFSVLVGLLLLRRRRAAGSSFFVAVTAERADGGGGEEKEKTEGSPASPISFISHLPTFPLSLSPSFLLLKLDQVL